MKEETILLLGIVAVSIYYLMRERDGEEPTPEPEPEPEPTPTPIVYHLTMDSLQLV